MKIFPTLSTIFTLLFLQACISQNSYKSEGQQYKNNSSEAFNQYWYAGEAELNSYELEQARYGEIRKGEAVLVFVTEDFLIQPQVKKDYKTEMPHTSVLKTNLIKKFVTGVYDYSMMSSVFSPVNQAHLVSPIKTTTSSQEWCGHTWLQFNRRSSGYEIAGFSYFQKEGDIRRVLNQNILEDGFWNQIRINPELIPQGKQKVVPSSQYLRLAHKEIKAYEADIKITTYHKSDIPGTDLNSLEVSYPELNRSLEIIFESDFPHLIAGWKENRPSGFGKNAQQMTSSAKRVESLKSPYWEKNALADSTLRSKLLKTTP